MNSFAAHMWNAYLMLERAVPVALKTARSRAPSSSASALRDALEGIRELVTTHGVMNMSPTDHMGFDQRARVMVQIRDGGWTLAK